MRIAYLARVDAESRGVVNKILAQAREWKKLGIDPYLYLIGPAEQRSQWKLPVPDLYYYEENYGAPLFARFIERSRLYREIYCELKKSQPNLVYFRYDYFTLPLYSIMKDYKTVVELNTDDRFEFFLFSKLYGLYNLLTRNHVLNHASGFILVTRELMRIVPANKPTKVVSNGINLLRYSQLPLRKNPKVQFIFSGTSVKRIYPWHGIDKILYLASKLSECDFTLVGFPKLEQENLRSNIKAFGVLDGESYDMLFQDIDLGISTLALHRKKMDEACPLKTREYLARGLPVILGYRDTDLDDDFPFALRLPNTEDNVERFADRILEFACLMKGQRVPREFIAHLDVRFKERERVEFFTRIVSN